jgi:hypothetical protein
MYKIRYPLFNSKRILKKEMLNYLRDYPEDVLNIYMSNMSDGICYGFEPKVDKNIITFSKGIIKHKGRVYVIGEEQSISYEGSLGLLYIKLNFYDNQEDEDYDNSEIDIVIEDDPNLADNQCELGRFYLKSGAYLRSDYQDLYDFTTEYNTINIVHTLYAGVDIDTVNPMVIRYFANAAFKHMTREPMDIHISALALNSTRVERSIICYYIAYRLEEGYALLNNESIHKKLVIILDKIKKETQGVKKKRSVISKIIVD